MKNYKAIDRCSLILSLIISKKYKSSIYHISHDYDIPIDIVRRDISKIIHNNILKDFIYFDTTQHAIYNLIYKTLEECLYSDDIDYIFEEFDDENESKFLKISFANVLYDLDDDEKRNITKRINNLITSSIGYLDNVIISFENNSFFDTYTPIPINDEEESLLQREYPELIKDSYKIKKTIWDNILPKESNINIINKCLKTKHQLKFTYRKSTLENYIICPAMIYYNTFDNTAYCIDNNNHIYRIDKMFSLKETNQTYDTINIFPYYDYLWGSPIYNQEERTHVIIQIKNNTSNIIQKIENETMYRKYRQFYFDKDQDCYYYEDDIIGINSFKRWLRSYGSSLIVIEPLSLASDMYQSSLKILENYKKDN